MDEENLGLNEVIINCENPPIIEIDGTGNKIQIKESIFTNSKIKITGDSNTIIISEDSNFTNMMVNLNGTGSRVTLRRGIVSIGSLSIFQLDNNSIISIGSNTTFEETSISIAEDGNKITIGNDCMFARQISILGSDFHSIYNLDDNTVLNKAKGITLGDHVWVNSRCLILKNTNIGSNSILAAGAIVCKDVPENCIVGGVPAKIIKQNINWDRKRLGARN